MISHPTVRLSTSVGTMMGKRSSTAIVKSLVPRSITTVSSYPQRRQHLVTNSVTNKDDTEWSGQLSFTSPESDFVGQVQAQQLQDVVVVQKRSITTTTSSSSSSNSNRIWSEQISYASPESDFTSSSQSIMSLRNFHHASSKNLHATTPNDDMEPHSLLLPTKKSSSSSALTNWKTLLDTTTTPVNSWIPSFFSNNGKSNNNKSSSILPETFFEALLEKHNHKKAIVVTTMTSPHRIVYVNDGWVDMCGYQPNEVLHKTLECIQGPQTNVQLVTDMVRKVEEKVSNMLSSSSKSSSESDTKEVTEDLYVMNYKKDGTAFINHLTLGCLKFNKDDNDTDINLMVGVLEEIPSVNQVPIRMI